MDLAIYNFGGDGVRLANPAGQPGDQLFADAIGADAQGNVLDGNGNNQSNGDDGIFVTGADDTIGGKNGGGAFAGNVIAGNASNGINLSSGALRTTIQANLIGATIVNRGVFGQQQTVVAGNGTNGINVSGGGGNDVIASNTTEANGFAGILVSSNNNSISGNVVLANGILGRNGPGLGTGSSDGIDLESDSSNNTINGGNLIVSNYGNGITVNGTSATNNSISANNIGVGYFGTPPYGQPVGNGGFGIALVGASATTIGGTVQGNGGNSIGSNGKDGVNISG